MRQFLLLLAACVLAPAVVVGQEDSPREAGAASPKSYVVQLTEFRFHNAADPKLSAADIVRTFQQPNAEETLELIETVRLSALESHETTVQFGRNAALTVGVANFSGAPNFPGGRNTRQIQYRQVGTLVRLTAQSQEEKVLLKLTYEVSRLEGRAPDDPEADSPDVIVIQFNTTLLVEPGKPTLVGGTSAEPTNFLLVSVEELTNNPG
jgi:hypothetical protein